MVSQPTLGFYSPSQLCLNAWQEKKTNHPEMKNSIWMCVSDCQEIFLFFNFVFPKSQNSPSEYEGQQE